MFGTEINHCQNFYQAVLKRVKFDMATIEAKLLLFQRRNAYVMLIIYCVIFCTFMFVCGPLSKSRSKKNLKLLRFLRTGSEIAKNPYLS